MLPPVDEHSLTKRHRRGEFDCGEPALNDYLARFATQAHQRGGAKTFVVCPKAESTLILGYYSLAPACLAFARVPATVTKGLARHDVPMFRLARLAVDLSAQGMGLGQSLLILAGQRCIAVAQEVGGVALLIEAKSERAARWYAGFGAVRLDDAPMTLVLPLATLAAKDKRYSG
ncbi:MAG TPA: GNAT family N-acetyltransferase [Hyphomicrobiaceae bacterium]|nr:GNAT family N-acetyltransferase [Hyphomicrobiaceae bacterium]